MVAATIVIPASPRARLLVATALALLGCAPDSSAGPSARDLANAAKVDKDRLVFEGGFLDDYLHPNASGEPTPILDLVDAYAKDPEGGHPIYLLADRADSARGADGFVDEGSKNPLGFARKVVRAHEDGDQMVLDTKPASLEQVIGDVDLSGAIAMEGGDGDGASQKKPQDFGNTIPGPSIPRIDLTGRVLYDDGTSQIRLGPTYLELGSTIEYGLKVSLFKLRRARLVIHGKLDAQLVLEATTTPTLGHKEHEKELFATKLYLPPAGPIPLTLRVSLTAGCLFDGAAKLEASVGVHATAALDMGFDYDKDGAGLTGIGDLDVAVAPVAPSFAFEGTLGATCYLTPRYEVLFFDAVGPYNGLTAYADLDFHSPPAHLTMDAGYRGEVGGSARLFSFELGKLELPPLFDVKKPVFDGPSP